MVSLLDLLFLVGFHKKHLNFQDEGKWIMGMNNGNAIKIILISHFHYSLEINIHFLQINLYR